jgi:Mrp family chromosome partitioning ATPase
MKVTYIITATRDEDPADWSSSTREEMLKCLKEEVEEDPDYILSDLGPFSIEVKLGE